ncbi:MULTISPECIES: YlaF family protein [unclassified Staphylococcus]|uniref:YlaF family protein n=1 Tax=unclassified Staphylococcus TaxID=91994 RepID=UPI0021D09EF7|nr:MULTISPECIES: YlaF family protein [unclassified Staphylococcus]UXR70212.1 YlaF family protein [Staphylococcus sp. IVB6246]UXR72273.1 YlaF family protein [Staphylococcus sp. IVB6240]UXR74581.1 YlaF family protein [Staphylococcus sp. IVB6238]UXR76966.1 YlaF family protein [Staphylococcus sp. IVB6233]UXR81092.1 YlaF family protein [Staphylococcus sp. IVB6218]
MQKSKTIFLVLAIIAVFFLTMFSFAIAAGSVLWMVITFALMMVTFGYGFTLKKKYRENDWL